MDIILETARLYLRRFTDCDADALLIYELNSDAEVLKYLHEQTLTDASQGKQILRNTILPQYELSLGRWAVHLKLNDEFIGWCGLKHRPELGETDLGYRLKKAAWGKGYATESAAACLEYGFKTLHLHIITGRAHVDNSASLSILQKIGMQYVRDEIVDNCPVKTFEGINTNPQ